ncbi:recombinase [Pseudooceanicola sp. HF7]|uniref:recombinase n=1 Tax=Pseudooceanicola sp. HF7 TaxID=2721560 RepID=UPI001431D10B|nr:recombinase [Pseudooceanicola sp. HF7]NIZ10163.1 recombinase [Pseudooceanicola sp. HF7]
MKFKDALWDGSDPDYAPGRTRSKNLFYWKPPAQAVKEGYPGKRERLVGEDGDGRDQERARRCRELTREVYEFFNPAGREPITGTWAWLIERYRSDRFSPIHKVKANTRESYLIYIGKLEKAIGPSMISGTNYEVLCQLRDGMLDRGRTPSYVKKIFTHLRIVANYGSLIENEAAARVAQTLAGMRIESAPKKSKAPTQEQIRAIVDKADEQGLFAFATGLLFQWVFALRAVDVRGQWLECSPDEAGIVRELARNRRQMHLPQTYERWQDGLTWEMFEDDLSGFRKTISKTRKSMPEPLFFDMTYAPELQHRLRILGSQNRAGPVIVGERTGMPYTRDGWTQAFIRCRRAAGISEEVKMMDTRAGALSEASSLGIDPTILRDAAGHQNVATTDRYLRNREKNIASVVQLRSRR